MSLLPLELLACGTIPVVNDGPNNRLVSDNPYVAYCDNYPAALAQKLSEVVTRKNLPTYAQEASGSVAEQDWDASGAKFVKIVERELRNG
jgi:glycosyltransferase involved in cell wall biosynthesis